MVIPPACGLLHVYGACIHPMKLQAFAFLVIAVVAAWLLLRVIKKLVIAVLVVILCAVIALVVYLKFF